MDPPAASPIFVDHFSTEDPYDHLEVNCVPYSGKQPGSKGPDKTANVKPFCKKMFSMQMFGTHFSRSTSTLHMFPCPRTRHGPNGIIPNSVANLHLAPARKRHSACAVALLTAVLKTNKKVFVFSPGELQRRVFEKEGAESLHPHILYAPAHLTSAHLTPAHLASSHLMSTHLTFSHLTVHLHILHLHILCLHILCLHVLKRHVLHLHLLHLHILRLHILHLHVLHLQLLHLHILILHLLSLSFSLCLFSLSLSLLSLLSLFSSLLCSPFSVV